MSPLDERRAQRRELAVDPRAHAPVPDVRVDPVREVDRRGPAWKREDLALGREGVDLVRVQVDLQGREELLRVGDLALPVDELPQPLETGVVGVRPEPALLVLPVRRDAALGDQVHLPRADLDLEGLPRFAHDRRVERLVEVGLGHRDVVLDPPGDRPPELVDHAERFVAVARLRDHDAQGQDVVELRGFHAHPLHLQPDGVVALHAARDLGGDAGLPEARLDAPPDVADHALGHLHAPGDLAGHPLVLLGLEVQEREVLELALDAAHAEPVRDRRVDVQGLPRDLAPPGLGQEPERAHVVEPVGELDHHDPQVGDHRQDHLAEGLGLLLLARDVGELADLRQPVDELGDLVAELLRDGRAGGQRVFEDVVEQAHHDRDVVGLEIGEDRRDVQGVHEVGLPRAPHLPLVLARREDVRPPQQVLVAAGVVALDLLEDLLEVDHGPKGTASGREWQKGGRATAASTSWTRTPARRAWQLRAARREPGRRRACPGPATPSRSRRSPRPRRSRSTCRRRCRS